MGGLSDEEAPVRLIWHGARGGDGETLGGMGMREVGFFCIYYTLEC